MVFGLNPVDVAMIAALPCLPLLLLLVLALPEVRGRGADPLTGVRRDASSR